MKGSVGESEEQKDEDSPYGKGYESTAAGRRCGRDETDHRHDRVGQLQPDAKSLHSNMQSSGKNS